MPILQGLLKLARPAITRLNRELERLAIAPGQPRLAVLIDAENIPAASADQLLAQIRRWGHPVVMRVYADWTNGTVHPWKQVCRLHPMQAIHQHNYVKGKSTTDMALIIDAMDLLHGEIPLDGFCLISSDSDFAPLAIRLRQHGKLVFGIGQHKAISGLQNACHHFVMLDQPVAKASKPSPPSSPAGQPGKIVTAPITQKRIIHTPLSQDPALQTLLQDAFDKQPKQQWEWLDINKLDSALKEHLHYQSIRKQFPSLSKMLMALNYLELGHRREQPGVYLVRCLPNVADTPAVHSVESASADQKQALFDRISILARIHADEQNRVATTVLRDALLVLAPSFRPQTYGHISWEGLLAEHPELRLCDGPTTRVKTMLVIKQVNPEAAAINPDSLVHRAIDLLQRSDHWCSALDVLRYLQHPLTGYHWPENATIAWKLLGDLPYLTIASDTNRRELLVGLTDDPKRGQPRPLQPKSPPNLSLPGLSELITMIVAFQSDSDGWISLEKVLSETQRHCQLFAPRHYGQYSICEVIEADGQFETQDRDGKTWVRLRVDKPIVREDSVLSAQAA